MVGTLSDIEIDALLADQKFARLGCHALGQTYVVPISFAYSDGRILGQTTPGKKIEMMKTNPEVCVEVDDVRSLTDWRSAIVWGRFEELTGIEAIEAMGKLLDRYGPIFEESRSHERLGRNVIPERVNHNPMPQVVYAIHITKKTGRFERPDA